MNKPTPGIPRTVVLDDLNGELLSNLYALDYIKYSTMKRTLLLMPAGANINEVVDLAKAHCKKRAWTFSHIELAITNLSGEAQQEQQNA